MIDLRFRPVDKPIPGPKGGPSAKRFGCAWGTLLDDLEAELGLLKAADIIVEADLERHQIRNDGWPRGGCAPKTPGIRLSFVSKHGPMAFTCATFRTMEENLRAIGLTLQRLRLIDEYGATRSGEQYRGFSALPPGGIHAAEWASVEDAIRWLANETVLPAGTPLQTLYREAAKLAHPDAGGSNELMAKVNRAKDFIEKEGRS